jgi:nucleoside-diphosphate-sugar epimerase
MKSILLLGSGGFVGSHILVALNNCGQFKVTAPRSRETDLTDQGAVERLFDDSAFDIIIHSAILVSSLDASIKMMLNVLRAASEATAFIHIGSGAEYDRFRCPPNVQENEFGKRIPSDDYGISKYLISKVLNDYRPHNTLNLRVFGVFGTMEQPQRLIPSLVSTAITKGECTLKQDAIFSFIPIEDLCRFLLVWLKEYEQCFGTYNFVGPEPILLSKIMQIVTDEIPNTKSRILIDGMQSPYYGSNYAFSQSFPSFHFSCITKSVRHYVKSLVV